MEALKVSRSQSSQRDAKAAGVLLRALGCTGSPTSSQGQQNEFWVGTGTERSKDVETEVAAMEGGSLT